LQGKVEFEAMEDGQEDKIMDRIVQDAVRSVFDRHFDADQLDEIAMAFNDGLSIETGEGLASTDYAEAFSRVPGLAETIAGIAGESEPSRAAGLEFLLEGMHLHKLLNKYTVDGRSSYMG
jgi:magnesium chelatase subunit I